MWEQLAKVYPKGTVEFKRIKTILGWRYSGIKTRCTGGLVKTGIPSNIFYSGLPYPKTRKEFYHWALNNEQFWILIENYINGHYQKRLSPSIDRIDSSKGYTFDNMRWLPWYKHCQISGHQGKSKIKRNATGFIGVFDLKKGNSPFLAYIKVNQKIKYLGQYPTAKESAEVRDRAARKYFGPEALLNFPEIT